MHIVSIMAAILEDELRKRGILELTQLDCKTMVHSIIERTAELETPLYGSDPNCTSATEPKRS